MSLGNWLYYRRKFKLIVLKNLQSKNKDILALTYERNWELPKGWNVRYYDINAPLKIITNPHVVIEREFNDGKAIYDRLYNFQLKKTSPKAFWFIDAHVSDNKRISYCDHFDFVFVAHSPYINLVKENTKCKNIFWLPLCYPVSGDHIQKNTCSIKYPVSFIGRYGTGFEKRNEMIDFLKKEYNENFFVSTDYESMPNLIKQSKITTNHSMKNDLNFRVFETLGYGAALMTNYVTDLDKIEGLKERLNCFNELTDLKTHIDSVLSEKQKKHNIYETQEWIKQNHTMKNRLAEMLQMINTGKQVEYK